MKTKILLLITVFAASTLCVSAQRLLISEEFSSPEWQAELLRLNPGFDEDSLPLNPNAPNANPYAARTPNVGAAGNYAYVNMNLTDLYHGKYKIAGDIEIINGEVHPKSDTCALDGGNHNVMITEGDSTGKYIPLGFRPFKTDGYIELPEITSAGIITVHVISGNNSTASTFSIDKWENEAWIQITTKNINKRSSMGGMVDRIQTEDINSRIPIKLRLSKPISSDPYFAIFEFAVEEHASVELKQYIDSASVILTDNAGNIGTEIGEYPQAVYDSLSSVVDSLNVVHDDLSTGRSALIDANIGMKDAITYFYANANDIGTGFNPASTVTIKQYGRKLVVNEPTRISIYNIDGTLLYQQDRVKVMEVPSTIGQGIYLVKSNFGVQKMYFSK